MFTTFYFSNINIFLRYANIFFKAKLLLVVIVLLQNYSIKVHILVQCYGYTFKLSWALFTKCFDYYHKIVFIYQNIQFSANFIAYWRLFFINRDFKKSNVKSKGTFIYQLSGNQPKNKLQSNISIKNPGDLNLQSSFFFYSFSYNIN